MATKLITLTWQRIGLFQKRSRQYMQYREENKNGKTSLYRKKVSKQKDLTVICKLCMNTISQGEQCYWRGGGGAKGVRYWHKSCFEKSLN